MLLNTEYTLKSIYSKAKKDHIPFNSIEKRKIVFNINGKKLEGYYSNEALTSNSRFEVIEYIFDNKS